MTNHRPPTHKEMKRPKARKKETQVPPLPVYGSRESDWADRADAVIDRARVLGAPIGTELPASSDPRSGNHPAPRVLPDRKHLLIRLDVASVPASCTCNSRKPKDIDQHASMCRYRLILEAAATIRFYDKLVYLP